MDLLEKLIKDRVQGYVPDWSDKQNKYYVAYSHWKKEWVLKYTDHVETPGITYLRKNEAKKLLQLLNNRISY